MKILVLYPGTTVSTYHEESKFYCTHAQGHMPPTTSIYSSRHLAAKEEFWLHLLKVQNVLPGVASFPFPNSQNN
jgi:hypothetical protein